MLLSIALVGPAPAVAAPEAEALVQQHLGLWLARPDRREAGERATITGETLEIWFLRPLRRGQRDAAVCDGFRWLIGGRLESSKGAAALFAARPELSAVTLVFYEVETRVDPDAEGKYVQSRNAAPRARFTITRDTAAAIDAKVALQSLKGDGCQQIGESLVDGFWAP